MTKLAPHDLEIAALHGPRREFGADSIVESFERHSVEKPELCALVCEQERLSYGQLNRRANALAWSLRRRGVKRGEVVVLAMERSAQTIVALLAVLKAGAAFLCVDTEQPLSRRDELIRASGARVILSECGDDERSDNPTRVHAASDLAYLLYTSGSTGVPKGVRVEHGQLWNYVNAVAEFLDLPAGARYATVSTFAADLGHSAVFPALCNRGELHVVLRHRALNGALLGEYIESQRIDLLKIVPSHFEALFQATEQPQRLIPARRLVFGGEACSWNLVDRVTALRPECQVINHYGPTETTVGVTTLRLNEVPQRLSASPPIGRPLANTSAYVLDARLDPVRASEVGELYVGGSQVARGYLDAEAETAQRFIANPFGEGRLYRTGDLVRVLADGTLHWVGRADEQVKIRGHRIELGEVEARLRQCEGVGEAVVVARKGAEGEKRLVAYYTCRVQAGEAPPGNQALRVPSADALREQLARQLPEVMVPAAFVALQALPLTPNGKIDRMALPEPDAQAYARQEYEAPVGAAESALAGIWSEVLGIERIGRRDNFFALGGHSLLAVRVVSRVQQRLGVELELGAFFDKPELSALAAALQSAARSDGPAIEPVPREQPLALSFAQQRLWFLSELEGASQAYHICMGMRLTGELDREALQRALDRIVARHEALRTTFIAANGEAAQHVARPDIGLPLQHHDLREHKDAAQELQRLSEQHAGAGFDLETGPLIRARLIQLGDAAHVLLLTLHHIVSDGWSRGVLGAELSALYSAFSRGKPDPLPALQVQYPDFAAWQRRWLSGALLQTQSQYWRRTLKGAPELIELPTDRPRPQRRGHAGGTVEFALDEALSAGLKALAQRHGMTLFMTLLAAWGVVLARLSGQDEVVIGTPVANRRRSEIEPLIGFFVNTLALRLDASGSPSVTQWLERVKTQALAAQQHQDLPFEQVVEILRPARSLAHSPLFQVMLAWEGQQSPAPELPGLKLEEFSFGPSVAKFDLTLTLREQRDGRIGGEIGYASALYDTATVERQIGYLCCISKAMLADEAQAIDALQILPEAERHKLLVQWNDTKVHDADLGFVHELFEALAVQQPSAVALRQGDKELSYGDLNARANQLAHHLRTLGVKPDDRVAILVNRSFELVVALLATLKASAAYLPLDPTYPAQRLAYMLQDSAPMAILTQGSVWADLQQRGGPHTLDSRSTPVLDLLDPAPPWAGQRTSNPLLSDSGLTPQHLAYVIYTSGSTGAPKGVMVEHRQLANLVHWHRRRFGTTTASCSSLLAGIAFDASTWELWPALTAGAKLLLPSPETDADPMALLSWWKEQPFDASFLPTPLAELGFAEGLVNPHLKTLLIGGDALRGRPPADLSPELVNNYGPTECAVVATSGRLETADGAVHIGRPIANGRAYVLDRFGAPVPIGVRGELCIGGVGVARGYLNHPDLTAERFVPDPYCDTPGARIYKTGDLARYLPNGNIEFLGRSDYQVKIRGFRIELGEIEARLSACAGVGEVLVLAREDSPGEKRLVAYYTGRSGSKQAAQHGEPAVPDAHSLREQLALHLPTYMVPAAFVVLQAFPLTANGKVDRKALPAPDAQAFAGEAFEAPIGEIECTLARIWREVLRLQRVGRRDNFFDLGGHSLLATQVIARVRRDLGIAAPVRAMFESPSLQGFASRLRLQWNGGAGRVVDADPPSRLANRDGPLPTSFSQRRMWLVQKLNPDTTAYNMALSLRLSGVLDERAMLGALEAIVRRHEVFRTRFEEVNGEPMQRIVAGLPIRLERLDLGGHSATEINDRARRAVSEIAARPFDLAAAGPYRIALLRLGSREHVLLWVMHHAIGDHWSFGILLRELRQVYGALRQGRSFELTPTGLDYADFATWQRTRAADTERVQQMAYWLHRLNGVRPLTLPTDFPRVGPPDGLGGLVQRDLDPELIAGLAQVSRREGATAYMTLLACFQLLMARISGQHDIAVAAPIANRLAVFSESLVGTLVNTLVMRCDLSGNPTFAELLAQVRETALQAYAHQDVPFEQLVEAHEAQRDVLRAPLVQVMLNVVNAPFSAEHFDGITVEAFDFQRRSAQFELSIGVDLDVFRRIQLSYASGLFAEATAHRLLECFMTILQSVLEDPNRRIDEVELLGETQQQDLVTWNRTDAPKPSHRSVSSWISSHALGVPGRPALRDSSSMLSHGELDAHSNRLARTLRARGIRRGALVGLCVDRSVSMVIAQLAILKSGAAYVPLDPAYPPDRLAMMADDAQLALLVTQATHASVLAWPREKALWLDADAADIEAHDSSALAPDDSLDAGPDDPAYVIYTSGSTGKPKGVAVPHGAVLNFLASMAREPGLRADDRVLAVTTLSFDIAVLELLLPLAVGATIVLATTEQAQDGRALRACLEQSQATLMQATPSTWRMLLEAGWQGTPTFKALIGGEGLPLDLAKQLLARTGELWNMYGPTETTVWSTCWRVEKPESGISIGRPIANTQVHVLDEAGRPCPIGVPGEIYIGGDGVAIGYLNRPELTAERFVADPFRAAAGEAGARMYRTGDLGRWRHDGLLEHQGRLDHQVKIRGFRIELGEIEVNLASNDGVARAIVIAREDTPGDTRIVAYIVPRGAMPSAAELREHVRTMLPQYMVPQHFVHLEAVPLLPNGKLDRSKLPKPGNAVEEAKAAPAALETDLERGIAEVWQRLLNIDSVGRSDNFFDLGGHSLLAMRAVSEIETSLGVVLSPRRLIFETLAQLAAAPGEAALAPKGEAQNDPAPKTMLSRLKRLFGAKAA